MNSRTLTLARITELLACSEARMKFSDVFGDSVEVSVERFSQPDVVAANFDYDWAVDMLLSEEQRRPYYDKLRKKRVELKAQYHVNWLGEVPRDARSKAEAMLWAEFYVASAPQKESKPENIAPLEGRTVGELDHGN